MPMGVLAAVWGSGNSAATSLAACRQVFLSFVGFSGSLGPTLWSGANSQTLRTCTTCTTHSIRPAQVVDTHLDADTLKLGCFPLCCCRCCFACLQRQRQHPPKAQLQDLHGYSSRPDVDIHDHGTAVGGWLLLWTTMSSQSWIQPSTPPALTCNIQVTSLHAQCTKRRCTQAGVLLLACVTHIFVFGQLCCLLCKCPLFRHG